MNDKPKLLFKRPPLTIDTDLPVVQKGLDGQQEAFAQNQENETGEDQSKQQLESARSQMSSARVDGDVVNSENSTVADFVEKVRQQQSEASPLKPPQKSSAPQQVIKVKKVGGKDLLNISMDDIQMERSQRIDAFLSCRHQAMPTLLPQWNLLDVFEMFEVSDPEALNSQTSSLWTFLQFLTLKDIIVLRGVCSQTNHIVPKHNRVFITLGNRFESNLQRTRYWQSKCETKQFEKDHFLQKHIQIPEVLQNLNQLSETLISQIQKDLIRTHSFAAPDTQLEDIEAITQILQAVAFIYPQVGYCQGMNYIAHTLHYTCGSVTKAIALFCSLIAKYNLAGLFSDQVPEYHIHASIIDQLLHQNAPQLSQHLRQKLQINLNMFTCQWVMTLMQGFWHDQGYELCASVLDAFIEDGWASIYKLALAIFSLLEPKILQASDLCELNKVMMYELKNIIAAMPNKVTGIFNLYAKQSLVVPPFEQTQMLEKLELQFYCDLVKQKLHPTAKQEWTKQDQTLLPSLISRIQLSQKPIRKEITKRHSKIQKLDLQLKKLQPSFSKIKSEYDEHMFMIEMFQNKQSILDETLVQLKLEKHTLQQTFNMKRNEQNLKNKQIMYHMDQLKAQGLSKAQISKKISEMDHLHQPVQFDGQAMLNEIKQKQADVAGLAQKAQAFKDQLQKQQDVAKPVISKYLVEKEKVDTCKGQKQKMCDATQSLIELVEQDKEYRIEEIAKAYQQVHNSTYRAHPLTKLQSAKEAQATVGMLVVMSDRQVEVDLSSQRNVAMQVQIHLLKQAKQNNN